LVCCGAADAIVTNATASGIAGGGERSLRACLLENGLGFKTDTGLDWLIVE
jgi:hypothetical protein